MEENQNSQKIEENKTIELQTTEKIAKVRRGKKRKVKKLKSREIE